MFILGPLNVKTAMTAAAAAEARDVNVSNPWAPGFSIIGIYVYFTVVVSIV